MSEALTTKTEAEEIVRPLEGLYVGQLTADEMRAFIDCVERGTAYRDYGAPGGFLGLAKVRMTPQGER